MMRCLSCGENFDDDKEDLQMCGVCELRGDFYLVTHNGVQSIIELRDEKNVVQKWKSFALRTKLVDPDEILTLNVDVKKIDHAFVIN